MAGDCTIIVCTDTLYRRSFAHTRIQMKAARNNSLFMWPVLGGKRCSIIQNQDCSLPQIAGHCLVLGWSLPGSCPGLASSLPGPAVTPYLQAAISKLLRLPSDPDIPPLNLGLHKNPDLRPGCCRSYSHRALVAASTLPRESYADSKAWL